MRTPTSYALACASVFLGSCASSGPRLEPDHPGLHIGPLVITEVAQASPYGDSTADKVEVYCADAKGCAQFKICDTGSSCSAPQPALAAHKRAVVSRGTSITSSDQVWIASADASELPDSRVGPFDCPGGQSESRRDCSSSSFAPCAPPSLGASSGDCTSTTDTQPFSYSIRYTTNQHGHPETTCLRAVCQELRTAIERAQSSIEFAIYGVRAQDHILDALVAAQARGVAVRGVVDAEDAACTEFGYEDTPTLIAALGPGNVHCDVGSGYGYIMHNKFFVFDGAQVWTGSTNLSDTELGGEYNSDVAALLSSYRLAEVYEAEFEEMFTGGVFHKRKTDNTPHMLEPDFLSDGGVVRSYFSPTDHAIANAVVPLVESATTTLDIAMFYFTSPPIADAIVAAAHRGVSVRMVLDASGASNSASKHGLLCDQGLAVKVENWGGKSHSKWAVADAGTEHAAVVFGSMNWTGAGDAENDENTLYVQNEAFAAVFHAEFERQWADLAGVPPCARASVEGADSSICAAGGCQLGCSSGSCCDGIDNDYDHKIDLEEEACACADGADNDHDGYVDAEDFDCQHVEDP
jgi:hypothetical protein